MALSHILEQTINAHVREYFEKGRIPFGMLSVNLDGKVIDVIFYEDGYQEATANLYIQSEWPFKSELTLTLPIDMELETL